MARNLMSEMKSIASNMSLSTIAVLLSIASLATVVVGDPTSVLTVRSLIPNNTPNEYFEPWSTQLVKGKKNTMLNVQFATKQELPPTIIMKFIVNLEGQDPIEYDINACDALNDPVIGASFVRAGLPKDKFPKKCPFGAGEWEIVNWDPPVNNIPPGVPDGPATGSVIVMEEGKEPYVKIDFEGDLSHAIPGFGR